MNLLLGNLASLKAAVLPPSMNNTDWDNAIAAIGKGVATSMQRHCNRLFERIVNDTFERAANCTYLSLPRFPVESFSLVELKVDEQSGWAAMPANTIFTLNKISGIAEFGSIFGSWTTRVRITYTGGFWADYTEDNSGSQPLGSTAAPDDLVHAWHLQVQHEIEAVKLFRGGATAEQSTGTDRLDIATGASLIQHVKELLDPFIRYS
jgi:hypothetical protein